MLAFNDFISTDDYILLLPLTDLLNLKIVFFFQSSHRRYKSFLNIDDNKAADKNEKALQKPIKTKSKSNNVLILFLTVLFLLFYFI